MATPTSLPATFVAGNVLTAAQMNDLRGAFRILQVVSTTKTDTFSASVAAGASSAVTGLSATITPSSTDSKILVIANVVGATSDGPYGYAVFNLKRDSTAIAQPASPGSRIPVTTYNLSISGATVLQGGAAHHLDSPATTSSVTYSVDVVNTSGTTATLYVNRGDSDTDASTRRRTVSSITVMEVSA